MFRSLIQFSPQKELTRFMRQLRHPRYDQISIQAEKA